MPTPLRASIALPFIAIAVAGCGTARTSTSTTTRDAAAIRAYASETQGFRPAIEGYVAQHFCGSLPAEACRCVRAKLDATRESAHDLDMFVRAAIRRDPAAMNDLDSYIGECQQ